MKRIREYTLTEICDMDKREINKIFRSNDDSNEWPIQGRFNATERAIRRLRKLQRLNGPLEGYEYWCCLDEEIVRIVNNQILKGGKG